jgi:hypothetical protein
MVLSPWGSNWKSHSRAQTRTTRLYRLLSMGCPNRIFCCTEPVNSQGSCDAYDTDPTTWLKPLLRGSSFKMAWSSDVCNDKICTWFFSTYISYCFCKSSHTLLIIMAFSLLHIILHVTDFPPICMYEVDVWVLNFICIKNLTCDIYEKLFNRTFSKLTFFNINRISFTQLHGEGSFLRS